MTTLQRLSDVPSYRFTATEQNILQTRAQLRTDAALAGVKAGWIVPKYPGNTPSGHMTGLAGEWLVMDSIMGAAGVKPTMGFQGWDMNAAGLRIDVKSWALPYFDKCGNSVNLGSLRSIATRQKAQGLQASVVAMCAVSKGTGGVPAVVWWYAWSTTDVLMTHGTSTVVSVYGKKQAVQVLPWHYWQHPSELTSLIGI